MAKFAQLKGIVENAEHDAEKFYNSGNQYAAQEKLTGDQNPGTTDKAGSI